MPVPKFFLDAVSVVGYNLFSMATEQNESRPKTAIGIRIREVRKSKNKSLTEVEGIDASNLSKYELGKLTPDLATLERIAAGLGVAVRELLP